MPQPRRLAGIDLAWMGARNPTALAWGHLDGSSLRLEGIEQSLFGPDAILASLQAIPNLHGITIDGPTIINNRSGQRVCERELVSVYGGRKAGCHASNLTLYPKPEGVALSRKLERLGFQHLARPSRRWQLEVYPHPAIIEIFGLPERHRYKKGVVGERREGQMQLAAMISALNKSSVLALDIPKDLLQFFDASAIATLRGRALKHNEDALDAVICLYIAALYQRGQKQQVFGDRDSGFIYVPQGRCAS
jgi:predicted RNase H-like nuclease